MSRRSPGAQRRPTQPERTAGATAARWPARRADLACAGVIIAITLGLYAPVLFMGRVLLPADVVPLMRPWAATARERYPDLTFAQNQMLGPIFEYYSWRHAAREGIRAGRVPLWNPDEMSGNVLLANSQSAVLYPPNVLLYLFSLPTGINLVTALHTFLTGLFMYGLMRALGARPAAALTSGLAWMLCGTLTVWTEFQTPTAVLCWLPGILWCWELCHAGRGWRWGVLGSGAGVALALTAGHLHFAFYVIVTFVGYAALRSVWPGRSTSRTGSAATVAAAVGFGILLSMATVLPVIEAGSHNFRGRHPDFASSAALRLPPDHLLLMVQPAMYGDPRHYVVRDAAGNPGSGFPYFGRFEFIEFTAYPGVPALILALGVVAAALLRRSPGLPVLPLAAVGAVGLLLALGTPLGALFFYGVPGYKQFNAPARALCMASFSLAALAGVGVEALARAREEGRERSALRIAVAAAGAVALACLAAYPVALTAAGSSRLVLAELAPYSNVFDKWSPYLLRGLAHGLAFAALSAAAAWLALRRSGGALLWAPAALAAADLLVWGAGFNPMPPAGMLGWPTEVGARLRATRPHRVTSLEAPGEGLKSLIAPNFNLWVGYREAQGADSLHTLRYHTLLEGVTRKLSPLGRGFADPNTVRFPARLEHAVFDMLNVRYATTVPQASAPGPAFRRETRAELTVWENTRACGPVWLVGAARTMRSEAALDALVSGPFDPRAEALLEVDGPPLDRAAGGGAALLTEAEPHRLEARVDAPGSALVVFSEAAYPGWRATVDGQPAPLLTANLVLRAVPVPLGQHTVALAYEPASWRLGLYLSAAALALGAALLAHGRARRA